MTISEMFLIFVTLVVTPLLFIGLPLYIFTGGMDRFGRRALERRFVGIETHASPQPGDVTFTYHTYRGFIVWATMDEHRIFAQPDEALCLLKRLLRFNLTWGMLSMGMIFIPFLAVGNYYAQKRSIESQRLASEAPDSSKFESNASAPDTKE